MKIQNSNTYELEERYTTSEYKGNYQLGQLQKTIKYIGHGVINKYWFR